MIMSIILHSYYLLSTTELTGKAHVFSHHYGRHIDVTNLLVQYMLLALSIMNELVHCEHNIHNSEQVSVDYKQLAGS